MLRPNYPFANAGDSAPAGFLNASWPTASGDFQ